LASQDPDEAFQRLFDAALTRQIARAYFSRRILRRESSLSLGFAKLAFVEWRKVMRYEYLGDNLADYCRRMR
jgi:hypothetical protein